MQAHKEYSAWDRPRCQTMFVRSDIRELNKSLSKKKVATRTKARGVIFDIAEKQSDWDALKE